jgi:hypothetical protein
MIYFVGGDDCYYNGSTDDEVIIERRLEIREWFKGD